MMFVKRVSFLLATCSAWMAAALALGAEPCQSGPQPGQRTGEYSALISTGTQRGKSHCFICDSAERPTVIIFARTLNDSLAKLVQGLDRDDHKDADVRSWVTFLSNDQTALDSQVVAWAKKQGVRGVPLGIFEDLDGPPSYRLNRDADLTILLNVKQKVVVNFSLRAGELNDEKIAEVLKAIDKIAGDKK